jgi:hypothetical protein
MSNDTRFWLSRAMVFVCIFANLVLLTKILEAGISGSGAIVWWFFLLLLVTVAGLVLAIKYYYRTKANRWEQNQADAETLAIETLAALGKQHQPQPPAKSSDRQSGRR